MRHKVQISIDEALKNLGEAARDCHELSLDAKNAFREQWGAINDQLMATITMLIGIRHVASDTIDRQLSANKSCDNSKHKERDKNV